MRLSEAYYIATKALVEADGIDPDNPDDVGMRVESARVVVDALFREAMLSPHMVDDSQ